MSQPRSANANGTGPAHAGTIALVQVHARTATGELPLVSVITPTATCGPSIGRALESVQRQDYPRVEHLIVGDSCTGLARERLGRLSVHGTFRFPMRVINASHPPAYTATYRPARAAHARTAGASAARGELLAFLDDDNEYELHHLRTMVGALAGDPELEAVYCWRQLLDPDGSSYLRRASPWATDPVQAHHDYEELVAAGVWIAGTNLLRDRLDWNTVDSSCWLIRRELLNRVPFRLAFTSRERADRLGEDVAFCFDLRQSRVPIGPVERHSVRYYIGGFSTTGERDYVVETDGRWHIAPPGP